MPAESCWDVTNFVQSFCSNNYVYNIDDDRHFLTIAATTSGPRSIIGSRGGGGLVARQERVRFEIAWSHRLPRLSNGGKQLSHEQSSSDQSAAVPISLQIGEWLYCPNSRPGQEDVRLCALTIEYLRPVCSQSQNLLHRQKRYMKNYGLSNK